MEVAAGAWETEAAVPVSDPVPWDRVEDGPRFQSVAVSIDWEDLGNAVGLEVTGSALAVVGVTEVGLRSRFVRLAVRSVSGVEVGSVVGWLAQTRLPSTSESRTTRAASRVVHFWDKRNRDSGGRWNA